MKLPLYFSVQYMVFLCSSVLRLDGMGNLVKLVKMTMKSLQCRHPSPFTATVSQIFRLNLELKYLKLNSNILSLNLVTES